MGATVNLPITFDTMADDPAMTMGALRCEGLNRAFETVEDVGLSIHRNG
ncbi:MAG TPA: hypothetical protein VHW45_15810 [Candidatus Sulfotelmatobacter sp.]|jgi:hypothetical protein|nr:hypothetical protein [Candidatus Sulfotelmatobacter sp.]